MEHRRFLRWKHRLYASRGVRAHSPFIYEMSLKVFEPSYPNPAWKKLEKAWNGCFGKSLSHNQRKKGSILSRFVDCFEIKNVAVLGIASIQDILYISLSNSKPHIDLLLENLCMEPCTQEIMKQLDIKNIYTITIDRKELFPVLGKKTLMPDMLFISASYPAWKIFQYFEAFVKYADNDSVFILDDIYFSKEGILIWEQIKACEKVTVTIDLYSMGIVFLRKESSKEDFIIRY